ncbi:hypothetical protein ACFL20_09800 [Spirochaetota bacterium]
MKENAAEMKLELVNKALNHFYETDADTLISKYEDEIRKDKFEDTPGIMDKETALKIINMIPDKCYKSKSLEVRAEMVRALTEEELQGICEEQVKAHPDIESEIRSMFKFCLNSKKLIESDD